MVKGRWAMERQRLPVVRNVIWKVFTVFCWWCNEGNIYHHPNAASPHEAHCSVIVTCVAADCGRLFAQLCSTGSSIGSALFGLAPRSSPFGE